MILQGFSEFCQELREARNGAPLYHGTLMMRGIRILDDGYIKSSTGHKFQETGLEHNSPRHLGVSLTRSFSFAHQWVTSWLGGPGLIFQFDQDKISQRYRFRPFNYSNQNVYNGNVTHTRLPGKVGKHDLGSEYEEFVVVPQNPHVVTNGMPLKPFLERIFCTATQEIFEDSVLRDITIPLKSKEAFVNKWKDKIIFGSTRHKGGYV